MIVLVGDSASGKSTIENILVSEYGWEKTVSYTTRKPRYGEIDKIDYNFITEDDFNKKFNEGFFVEVGAYNGWFYGTTAEQYTNNTVCVLTPHGLRQLKKQLKDDVDICSFYIDVPRKDRLIRLLNRGDNVDEAIRRNQSDVGMFDGIKDEVDYIIQNSSELNKSASNLAMEIVEKVIEKKWGKR